jgi:EmrB/QacA subfamily drug resistance transporter
MTTPLPKPPEFPRHLKLVYAMLIVMLVLSALDQTIVSTALPSIAREFHGTSRMSWVFSSYLIASTVAVPVYGKLADLHGTKPVLLTAVALFLLGSALCGISTQMDGLILARGLQGAGGGGLLTLAMMAVVRGFNPELRARLQGTLGASYGLSTMAGPLVGGFLVEHFSWRWAFFINLPVGLIALAVLARQFPRHKPDHHGRMDYLGALVLCGALVSLLLSTHHELPGESGWPTSMLIVAGAALAALFIWMQARSSSPLLPLSLFEHRQFSAAVAMSAASGLTLFAAVVFLPLYLQTARGLSPADSGWHLMPLMAGITVSSVLSGRHLSRTGQVRKLAMLACLLSAAAFVALGFIVRNVGWPLGLISLMLLPLGLGVGALFPLVTVAAQNAAPLPLMGIATASPVMFRSVAGALGVSVMGSIFAQSMASRLAVPGAMAADPAIFGASLSMVLWTAGGVCVLASGVACGLPLRLNRRAAPA